MKLHVFTEEGLAEFHENLNLIKANEASDLDSDRLFSRINLSKYEIDIDLPELPADSSKRDFIIALSSAFHEIDIKKEFYNAKLWTFLSAFYFDLVCPKENGQRFPKAEERHILSSENWRRYYRHLIAAPFRLYAELGELAVGYLDGKINVHGEFFEQMAAAQDLATSRGVIEAANILFWDSENRSLKYGSRGKDKPGTIRRFARDIMPQFQMTYDLNSMSGNEIIELLPSEFERWL